MRNSISYAIEDKQFPLFIDVLAYDVTAFTNTAVHGSESSSSFHPPSPSYVIRSTFQHRGFGTSVRHMDHCSNNCNLRALEDFVQLLQGLQWRKSVVVRLDLKQLRTLHATLSCSIRDGTTHAHLPPSPNPYDLEAPEQMTTGTLSCTLEGGAVRSTTCISVDLV